MTPKQLAERRRKGRERYYANREARQAHRRWRFSTDARIHLLWGARARAKERGIACEITIEDIVVPAACPVLGIPLVVNQKRKQDNSPTLDRVDNDRGYVKGNVCVISDRANRIKSNAGVEEVEAVARYMRGWRKT